MKCVCVPGMGVLRAAGGTSPCLLGEDNLVANSDIKYVTRRESPERKHGLKPYPSVQG